MSLFPIRSGLVNVHNQQSVVPGQGPDDPAAWLSNNSSFQPGDALQPAQAYGRYATQADFLRAAERYLDSSSDDDDAGGGGDARTGGLSTQPKPSQQPAFAASEPAGTSRGAASGAAPAGVGGVSRIVQQPSPAPSGGTSSSSGDGGARGKKRRRARSRSRSRSRDRSRKASKHGRKGRDGGKKRKGRDRKRRRRSASGSDSSSGSSNSDADGGGRGGGRRGGRGLSDREKILRLERAAAAAGIAPSAAAALSGAAKPILRSAATQPGEPYFDTRGDMENLVYECLYGGQLPSYNRTDPLGLAKGTRAHRLLPGQVAPAGVGKEEEETRGWGWDGRYFGGRAVAAERSRRLRRVFLAELPVLPGARPVGRPRDARGGHGGQGDVGGPEGAAGSGRRGWLLSRLEGPTTAAKAGGGGGGGIGGRMAVPLPPYLPLGDPAAEAAAAAAAAAEGRRLPAEAAAAAAAAAAGGESAEEWVLRRTREFNIAVREAPGDVQLWLRFAAFQDTVAGLLARRAAQVAGSAAEKKLAILQRALDVHPGEPRLLRAMMAACEPLVGQEELAERWERLLRRSPGVPALWRDYLGRRRSAFASVRLAGLQAAYGNAMHALASERARAQRAAAAAVPASPVSVSELDRELARLVLELAELELRAGASEAAVARLQALLEFHCFAPGALELGAGGGGGGVGRVGGGGRLPAGALLRLFDNYWESGAPRVGEEGARGWAHWYRREHEALWVAGARAGTGGDKQADRADPRDRDRGGGDGDGGGDGGGGWTGWMELPPLPSEPPPPLPPLPPEEGKGPVGGDGEGGGGGGSAAAAAATEGEEGELPAEDDDAEAGPEGEAEPQLTEEELLAALGLRLDEQLEEMQRQGVPPEILTRWLRTERERSARDWQPLHPAGAAGDTGGGASGGRGDGASDGGGDTADPHHVVLLEEIRDGIFPIEDPDLRADLVLTCLSLLGAPLAVAQVAGAGGGGAATVGCCSQSFLRLCPPSTAVAACQQVVPAAGGAAAAGAAGPWCLQHESRRAFVARLLRQLVADGPLADSPQLCLAYLLVEGARAATDDASAGDGASAAAGSGAAVWALLPCADRARAAARSLLSERRNSVAALAALAAVEEAAGQPRAARRIRDAALAGAAALPEAERRRLPLLVHQYAEAERAAAVAAVAAAAGTAGGGGGDGGGKKAAAAALEHALRAHHVLRWFLASPPDGGSGGGGAPYTPYKAGVAVTREDVAAARRGFEARIPGLLSAQGGALDAPAASCLYLGGVFEVLTARLFPGAGGGGLAAALTIFKHATAAVPAAVRRASGHHEALAVSYCGLVVSELEAASASAAAWGGGGGGPSGTNAGLPPARARTVLLQALELYPHNPALLALRVRLGRLAASQSRLRRDLAALAAGLRRAGEGSLEALADRAAAAAAAAATEGAEAEGPDPSSASAAAAAVWWVQLAAEAGGQPTSAAATTAAAAASSPDDPRVGRLLESAASARHLAPCAPVWLAYLGHEAAGCRLPAAKRVFLRAVREAPLDKELWMRGLELLGCGTAAAGPAAVGATAAAGAAAAGGGAAAGGAGSLGGSGAGGPAAAAAGRLSAHEVSELLGVAGDKGVRLRTDVYEEMLSYLAEQQE